MPPRSMPGLVHSQKRAKSGRLTTESGIVTSRADVTSLYLAGSVATKTSALRTQWTRASSVAMPAGATTTMLALGPRPMSNGRVAGSASARPASAAPTRTNRSSPMTPQHMWPRTRNESPPNIFFSVGGTGAAVASTARSRSASPGSKAMTTCGSASRRRLGQVSHVRPALAPRGHLLGPAELLQVILHPRLDVVPDQNGLLAGAFRADERGERLDDRLQAGVAEDRGRASGHRPAGDHPVPSGPQPPVAPPGEQRTR